MGRVGGHMSLCCFQNENLISTFFFFLNKTFPIKCYGSVGVVKRRFPYLFFSSQEIKSVL